MTYLICSNQVLSDHDFTEAQVRDRHLLKGLRIASGCSLVESWQPLVLDVISEYEPSDYFVSGPMHIVSDRLYSIISKYSTVDEIEYLPVIIYFDGNSYLNYGVLNIIIKIDVLNREKSNYTTFKGMVESVDSISIDEEKANGKSIFRIDAIEWIMCVDSELACEMEKEKITGIFFKTQDQWKPY